MSCEKTLIFESGKCAWGRCIFCSFGKKDAVKPDFNAFKERIDCAAGDADIDVLKFFNSGSFLDEAQISKEMRLYLFWNCEKSGVKELIVECRAEHATEMKLNEVKRELEGKKVNLIFAIGLEVADDEVLKKIRKGMTLAQYERAVKEIRKAGFGVRTYLMANLPFVGDIAKSLEKSVNYALKNSDTIAIINAFAYGYSPLFEMWLADKSSHSASLHSKLFQAELEKPRASKSLRKDPNSSSCEWHPLDKKEFEELTRKYKKNPKINIYFDDYVTYPKFPESMQKKLVGVGREYVRHPYFNVWQEYISRFYEIPQGKKYALFLPCSFRKPYSQSRTHREILRRLMGLRQYPLIHQIMISNPGVIPREFEGKYPFAHYDWQEWLETPQIKKEYIEATQNRIENYLAAHKYAAVFSYMKPASESFIALKNACAKLKIMLVSCVDEKLCRELHGKCAGLIETAGVDEEKSGNLLIERRMLDKMIDVLRKKLK